MYDWQNDKLEILRQLALKKEHLLTRFKENLQNRAETPDTFTQEQYDMAKDIYKMISNVPCLKTEYLKRVNYYETFKNHSNYITGIEYLFNNSNIVKLALERLKENCSYDIFNIKSINVQIIIQLLFYHCEHFKYKSFNLFENNKGIFLFFSACNESIGKLDTTILDSFLYSTDFYWFENIKNDINSFNHYPYFMLNAVALLQVLQELYNYVYSSDFDKKMINQVNLSNTEQNILNLVLKGLSSKDIANKKKISINTVNQHITNITNKIKDRNPYVKLSGRKLIQWYSKNIIKK